MLSVLVNRWAREPASSARRLAKEQGAAPRTLAREQGVAPKKLARLPPAEPVNLAKGQQTAQKRSVRKSAIWERKPEMWLPVRARKRRTRKPQSNSRLTHD